MFFAYDALIIFMFYLLILLMVIMMLIRVLILQRRVPPKADPISVDSASYPDSSSANEPPSPPPRPKVLQRHLESPSSDTYSAELNDNRNDEGAASSATYRRIHDDRRDGVGEDYDEESIEKEREFRRGGGGDDQQTDSSTSTQGNNRMTGGMFGKYFSSDTPDSRESTTAERHDGSNRSNTISELSENTLEWRSKHDSSRVTDGITSLKD